MVGTDVFGEETDDIIGSQGAEYSWQCPTSQSVSQSPQTYFVVVVFILYGHGGVPGTSSGMPNGVNRRLGAGTLSIGNWDRRAGISTVSGAALQHLLAWWFSAQDVANPGMRSDA